MSGADPEDAVAFADRDLPRLRAAVSELSWLLSRDYALIAAIAIVGDHHGLTRRQRMAIRRCAAPDAEAAARRARRVATLDGADVVVDGFNQLVTVERGLAGGAVLRGVDGALRDVASVHGTWRRSDRTGDALAALTAALAAARSVTWVLDAPVSNSGRLAEALRALGRGWTVELADRADARVVALGGVSCTSDAAMLDRCVAWYGLAEAALGVRVPIVDLSGLRDL